MSQFDLFFHEPLIYRRANRSDRVESTEVVYIEGIRWEAIAGSGKVESTKDNLNPE